MQPSQRSVIATAGAINSRVLEVGGPAPPDWRDRNDARIEQQKGVGRFEPFEKEYTR
jgi:hypothetical protein